MSIWSQKPKIGRIFKISLSENKSFCMLFDPTLSDIKSIKARIEQKGSKQSGEEVFDFRPKKRGS